MAFEKVTWVDEDSENFDVSTSPALNAMNLNRIEAGIDDALHKDGGTMIGSLCLSQDPISTMEAVTKQYADKNIKIIDLLSFFDTDGGEWVSEDTSIGKIPNWNSTYKNKYGAIMVTNWIVDGSRHDSITYVPIGYWTEYQYRPASGYGSYQIKINSSDGSIYFNKKPHYPAFLLLLPMEKIKLI